MKKISKKSVLALIVVFSLGINNTKAQETQETVKLSLSEAIEIALADNPTIIVAGQEIELKKEARKEAYGGLLPEASLSGTYQRAIKKQAMVMNTGDGPMTIEMGSANTYNGGLTISLPVFAPALYKAISLTKTDVELAVEMSRASKQDLVNQVTKAFFNCFLLRIAMMCCSKVIIRQRLIMKLLKQDFNKDWLVNMTVFVLMCRLRIFIPA